VYDNFAPKVDVAISPLRGFAIQTHELFSELKRAGFTEKQALAIVVGLIAKE